MSEANNSANKDFIISKKNISLIKIDFIYFRYVEKNFEHFMSKKQKIKFILDCFEEKRHFVKSSFSVNK